MKGMIVIKHLDEKGKPSGREIYLKKDVKDIDKLNNQLLMLGMNGLFYSPWANKIREKIKKLEKKE